MPDLPKHPILCTCGARIGDTTCPDRLLQADACPKCQAKKKNPK